MKEKTHRSRWIATIVISVAILWLTLSPRPTGGVSFRLFEHQDKVAHGIMFLALVVAMCYDSNRAGRPLKVLTAALLAIVAGGLIELAQEALHAGRTAEWADWAADSVGAIAGAAGWHWRHLFHS